MSAATQSPLIKATWFHVAELAATRFVAGFLLTIFAQVSAPECFASETGWRLVQTSQLCGETISYVSTNGAKFIFEKQGYTVVTAAPEWKAVIYNPKSKIYFKTTRKDYAEKLGKSMLFASANDIDPVLWVKEGSCMLNGKRAVKYAYRARKIGATVKTAECWFSEEIPLAPAVSEFVSWVDHTPRNSHMLVRSVSYLGDGTGLGHAALETTVCEKIVVPTNCYSLPNDYHLANNYIQVMLGNLGNELIDDMTKQ